jgi:uncharacterized protein YprB with RNaseH-like and TPR domain
MQIEAQKFLDLVEHSNSIVFFDIEASGLRGDYDAVLCASFLPFKGKPITFSVSKAGNDKPIMQDIKNRLEAADCWVTYYGKGFDVKMLNTRLLRHGLRPIEKRHHIDMYYTLKSNLLTARRSQGHLLDWLEAPTRKMSVSAEVWNKIKFDTAAEMPEMVRRCESDCRGLRDLYVRTRHLIKDIKC